MLNIWIRSEANRENYMNPTTVVSKIRKESSYVFICTGLFATIVRMQQLYEISTNIRHVAPTLLITKNISNSTFRIGSVQHTTASYICRLYIRNKYATVHLP